MIEQVRALRERLDDSLPDADLSDSWHAVRRRARWWFWPAIQMGVAAAVSWWIARQLAPGAAAYAPITAVGALGLGHERRLSRSAVLVAGLFVGVVAADVLAPLVGAGTWQIGVIMAITALVTGMLIDRELAVTYATINAVVLATIPGSEGWFPDRVLAGLVGVWTALTVIFGVLPPDPAALIRNRFRKATRRATEALEIAATVLRDGDDRHAPAHGERPLTARARRIDQELERTYGSTQFGREVSRWAPMRWPSRAEVDRLEHISDGLRAPLRTASTIARLADRAAANGVLASAELVAAIERAARAVGDYVARVLVASPPDDAAVECGHDALGSLLQGRVDHAILIALREEVRGLLAEVTAVVDDQFDGVAADIRERATATEIEGVTYGRAVSTRPRVP